MSSCTVIVLPSDVRLELFPLADRETFDLPLPCGHILRLSLRQATGIANEAHELEQELRGINPRTGEPY